MLLSAGIFYLSDGTQVVANTIIDGKRWMNYNVGASASNHFYSEDVSVGFSNRSGEYSVRCLKD